VCDQVCRVALKVPTPVRELLSFNQLPLASGDPNLEDTFLQDQ
jgi:hypothetical protein